MNEQPHSYWAKKFAASGFVVFDLFRTIFWENLEIESWYKQNAFLYVKKDSEAEKAISNHGHKPMSNLYFMNCIHPQMWDYYTNRAPSLSQRNRLVGAAKALTPPFIWSIIMFSFKFPFPNKHK